MDYRGDEVTVETFLRVLLNRHEPMVRIGTVLPAVTLLVREICPSYFVPLADDNENQV